MFLHEKTWPTFWDIGQNRQHSGKQDGHFLILGLIKDNLVYHPIQLKNAMRADYFFIFFLFSFVCPSPAVAGFKATKQSINLTKLLFIDRLEEKYKSSKVFTQDALAHRWIYFNCNKVKKLVLKSHLQVANLRCTPCPYLNLRFNPTIKINSQSIVQFVNLLIQYIRIYNIMGHLCHQKLGNVLTATNDTFKNSEPSRCIKSFAWFNLNEPLYNWTQSQQKR